MDNYRLEPEGGQVPSQKPAAHAPSKQLSLDEAMQYHDGLVHAYIRRHGGGDLSYEEALQAGRIGLWRAIRGYDPQRGFAFSTYAWIAISRTIFRAAQENSQRPCNHIGVLSGQAYSLELEAGMDQVLIHQALYELVNRLPQCQRRIIVCRYGLVETPTRQLGELGTELGLTGERVRQLQHEALNWLRHPVHSVRLRVLADKNSAQDYRRALRLNADWLRRRRGVR